MKNIRKILRVGELVLVILLILILCQLVFSVFDDFRMSSGLHPSRALIAVVNDPQQGDQWLIPWSKYGPPKQIETESETLTFAGFAPPSGEVRLEFNERLLPQKVNRRGMFVFPDIRLRRGLNVVNADLGNVTQDRELMYSRLLTKLFVQNVTYPLGGSTALKIIHRRAEKLPIVVSSLTQDTATGLSILCGTAEPMSSIYLSALDPITGKAPAKEIHEQSEVGPDGFFKMRLPRVDTATNYVLGYKLSSSEEGGLTKRTVPIDFLDTGRWRPGTEPRPVQRHLAITLDGNAFRVKGRVRVPEEQVLAEWINERAIDANNLLSLMFGLRIISLKSSELPSTQQSPRVLHVANAEKSYLEVIVEYEESNGFFYIGSFRDAGFPMFPDDMLELHGFPREDLVLNSAKPTNSMDGRTMTWQEKASPPEYFSTYPSIMYQPNHLIRQRETLKRPEPAARDKEINKFKFFSTFASLQTIIPKPLDALLFGIVQAAPFIFTIVILLKFSDASQQKDNRTALMQSSGALLSLFCTISLQPAFNMMYTMFTPRLFRHLTIIGFDASPLTVISKAIDLSPRILPDFGVSGFYPPLTIGTILLLPSIYQSIGQPKAGPLRQKIWMVFRWSFALILTFCVINLNRGIQFIQAIFGSLMNDSSMELGSQMMPRFDFLSMLPAEIYPWVIAALPLFIVTIASLVILWILLFWFLRSALYRSVRWLPAVKAGCVMLLLPMAPLLLEMMNRTLMFSHIHSSWLNSVTQNAWFLVTVFVAYKMLSMLLKIYQSTTPPFWHLKGRYQLSRMKLLFLSIIISVSATAYFPNTSESARGGIEYVKFLTGMLPLLHITIVIGILSWLRRIEEITDPGKNETVYIGMLLFSVYLAMKPANTLNMLIMLTGGALIFRCLIIKSGIAIKDGSNEYRSKLVERLKDFRVHLNRKKAISKKYGGGELTQEEYDERTWICDLSMKDALGPEYSSPHMVKEVILGKGPMDTSWCNGKRGAVSGLLVSLITMLPVNSASVAAPGSTQDFFALFFRSIIPKDVTHFVEVPSVGFPLLDFMGLLGVTMTFWTLAGFLFGFFFRVIRGRDGVEKALIFSAGLAIPQLLLAFSTNQVNSLIDILEMIIPLVFYLTIIALIAFDRKTIQRLGHDWSDLLSVYGFSATLYYGSSLLLIGGFQLGLKYILENIFS